MRGGETITREVIEDALDEIAPIIADYGDDFMMLTRSEMNAYPADESSEYDGWVVAADASSRLAQAFAFELGDAFPEEYYVEVGGLGSFPVIHDP